MKQVITANTLKTGEVVFLGAEGWVSSLEDAVLYEKDENLDEMMTLHHAPDHVMGLYAIDVEVKQGVAVAHHIREKIRVLGPGNYDHKRVGDTSPMVS